MNLRLLTAAAVVSCGLAVAAKAQDPVVAAAQEAIASMNAGALARDPAFLAAKAQWREYEAEIAKAVEEQNAALAGPRDALERTKNLYASRRSRGLPVDHYLYGRLMGRLGELEVAYGEFRKALELDRFFIWAWDGLAVYHSNRNQYVQAKDCFRNALKLNPGWEKASLGLAQVHLKQGEMQDAALLLDAIGGKGGPDKEVQIEAKMLRAEIARTAKDYSGSIGILDQLERDGVVDFRIHAMKAFCHRQLERWDEALRETDKLLRVAPNELRYLKSKATCLERLGRNHEAADALQAYLNKAETASISPAESADLIANIEQLRRRPPIEDPRGRDLKFGDYLDRLQHSPDVEKRRDAVFFLARAPRPMPSADGDRDLMTAFARALQDADPIVLAKSLEQLTVRYYWNDRVLDLARIFIEPRYDAKVRGMAAWCLRRWDHLQVVPELILALQGEADPYVFSQIHESLNSLTLAWIERILPEDITPEVIARNRKAWNEWYSRNRDPYRKNEPERFEERWKK